MCGIAGFISFDRDNGRPQWAAIAHSMGEALNHRGPDDKGTWLCPAGALIHRRLAVIDPDRGRQPMTRTRDCAEYTIVYNGELYNTDALRRELSDQGYRFETSSDTEVLLTAYMAWGEEVPARLEGIYAFVIWDGVRNQFFACRDRFGVKPFFYALADDGALVFGSELKALFQYPGLTPRVDAAGWCEVLGIGPARTSGCGVFSGVKELEPAPGFALADPDTQEAFIAAGEGHTFRFSNRPLSAISVWKYDSETGAAIEGAVFQVRYLSGNTSGTGGTVIGTYRTSANGSFTVTGCKAGTYIIEELSSDGSHVIDTPPQTVYLSGEDQEVVQVYFGNSPKGSLLIKKVSSGDNSPISDVQFFVTESDGTVVGDSNGYFTTDSAGTILIEGIDPGTTLVVKETRAKDGFLLDDTPQTAQIKAGQTVTLEFRNKPLGNLVIEKWGRTGSTTVPLKGVKFEIKYANGQFVDAAGGTLSSNGIYYSDSSGKITLSGVTGTVIVTELESVPGFTIDPDSQSQTVTINPNDTQTLRFYNNAVGGVEIIKVNASKTSERIPDTTFEIRRMDDALVDTITTDRNGRAYLALEDGSYYAVEIEANPDFRLDDTPHYFEVKNGEVTTLRIKNEANSGILIHKVDTSGEGIYGVKFLLYDEDRNPIGEFTSDDNGYVYITSDDLPDGANTSGRFYLRELEAAEGYILDEEYKTVYVRPGRTAEIEWVNEAITGQIQIYKYASEANPVTGDPAGTPLQGAVYEIIHERSGRVVDYITTDARGVAASKPLPLTRYKIREVTAPAYFQLDPTVHDVTLEYAGQIIKIAAYDKPANLKVTVTKTGNKQLLAGDSMRYDLTVANNSNVALENFYLHDQFPTDCSTAKTITTGTYNTRLNYQITYKTNYNDYRVLATNLLSTNNYAFDLSAVQLMQGEVVTDVRLEFGKVPAGFASVVKPTVTVQASASLANGYQVVNRVDAGGQYMSQWETGRAAWITLIVRLNEPTLPKTGY